MNPNLLISLIPLLFSAQSGKPWLMFNALHADDKEWIMYLYQYGLQ